MPDGTAVLVVGVTLLLNGQTPFVAWGREYLREYLLVRRG